MSLYKSLNVKILNTVSIQAPNDPKWRLVNWRIGNFIPTLANEAAAVADDTLKDGEAWYVDSSDEYIVKVKPSV